LDGGAADVAKLVDIVRGQAKGLLRIRGEFVKEPSGDVEARFVDQSGREGVIPQ